MSTARLIVLTGGPSAGKTTALHCLSKLLWKYQFRPLIIPDMATQMESFGLDFHKVCYDEETLRKWQSVQLRLQTEQEEALKFAASEFEFKNPVILVDRGLPSRAAYAYKAGYDLLMMKASMSDKIDLERYYGVIYMRTSAFEFDDFPLYDEESTQKQRHDSIEEAVKLCRRNEEVWSRHPNFHLVKAVPTEKFRKKLVHAGQCLAKLLDIKLEKGWESVLDDRISC